MKRWPFYITASFILLLLSLRAITIITGAITQEESQLSSEITVKMYALDPDSGAVLDRENPCRIDDPSTPQNEADNRYGCTAYPGEGTQYPYPYPTNPATVSIEDDYLLDVVPREMGTYYHPLALRAQAVAARTYAYCAIRANEGTEDFWGNCRKEINNSNEFQVFVPWYFESIDSPQVIQDAVNGTRGLYLIYAPKSGKGPIFSEYNLLTKPICE
jgi:peptidoglycan hydrolase-like amidase